MTSALDAYLSVQSNRMNEVMKTLTLISTVMLPLTFIVGLYGMNFDAMPEIHWRYGYVFALALMAVVGVGILLYFRHKGWIGDSEAAQARKRKSDAKQRLTRVPLDLSLHDRRARRERRASGSEHRRVDAR